MITKEFFLERMMTYDVKIKKPFYTVTAKSFLIFLELEKIVESDVFFIENTHFITKEMFVNEVLKLILIHEDLYISFRGFYVDKEQYFVFESFIFNNITEVEVNLFKEKFGIDDNVGLGFYGDNLQNSIKKNFQPYFLTTIPITNNTAGIWVYKKYY